MKILSKSKKQLDVHDVSQPSLDPKHFSGGKSTLFTFVRFISDTFTQILHLSRLNDKNTPGIEV